MRTLHVISSCLMSIVVAVVAPSAFAQQPGQSKSEKLFEKAIYSGVRASTLLGSPLFSKKGENLGRVRNIVLSDNGSVKAIIGEQSGIGLAPDFFFRLPWDKVVQPIRPGVLVADLSDVRSSQFGLFTQEADGKNDDFHVTEVIGDYARLQPGTGYGYVNDVVFAPQGVMVAVLIARDSPMGGGIVAFRYPGRTGRWNPEMSYYGLPFVTVEQANDSAIKVDPKQFESAG